MHTLPERLIRWRAAHGLRQDAAARLLGVGRTYLSRLETGERAAGPLLAARFEQLEAITPAGVRSMLADGETSILREEPGEPARPAHRPPRMIPRIGWAQAGAAGVDFADVVEWEEFVRVPVEDPKAIAITVRGDSMEPEIVAGDIVIVAPSHPLVNGKPAVIRTTRAVMLKNARREKDAFELRSVNPEHATIRVKLAEVLWIYPVAAVIHFP
jgi:phage repressor protein C with HTH and peptisase S24 domain